MINRKALVFTIVTLALSFVIAGFFLLAFEENVTAKDLLNRVAFIMASLGVYYSYGTLR